MRSASDKRAIRMNIKIASLIGALSVTSLMAVSGGALGESSVAGKDLHDHAHGAKSEIYNGYFSDSQVKARPLADWQGDWQSVYPYLRDGTLDPVFSDKAAHGDKSAAEYRAYYEIGYKTDVDGIVISGSRITFRQGQSAVSADYADDGYEVLTYARGNRGVRYIFRKTGGDAQAPQFIQFSDHAIAPETAAHFHLYWGADRAALLNEVTSWPTYYPAGLSGKAIVHEMLAH